jgi:hypothetical protein
MDEKVIPVQTAVEYYADATQRGERHGRFVTQHKVLTLLSELSESGPFDSSIRTGIKIALRAVKDMKID